MNILGSSVILMDLSLLILRAAAVLGIWNAVLTTSTVGYTIIFLKCPLFKLMDLSYEFLLLAILYCIVYYISTFCLQIGR